LKRNRTILFLFILLLHAGLLFAQPEIVQDSIIYQSESTLDYDPDYHFDDSAQSLYNSSAPESQFDSSHWKSLVKDMDFDEEKTKKDTAKDTSVKKKEKSGSFGWPSYLKYLWIAIAILILLFVLSKFLPAINRRNIKNNDKLIIGLDELDEEEIKAMDVETPLAQALREGDYRTAYRLRYLSVLKELINKNLILYKKEKTNYEYLLQLNGLPVYEPFRLLTFNFDGIWYGELAIDKEKYESLEQHFLDFNNVIRF
jgi:hypothetical protein